MAAYVSKSTSHALAALGISLCAATSACEGPPIPWEERGSPSDAGAETRDIDLEAAATVAAVSSSEGKDAAAPPTAEPAPQIMMYPSRTEIVDPSRWRRAEPSADPFEDRPGTTTCDPGATGPELFSGVAAYGVDTGRCDYVTVTQPITSSIQLGDTVTVRVAHFPLTAPEAAIAHVAVRVEELVVLDERIPIPSDSQVLVRSFVSPRAVPAGASAYFHVHNHGANSYALISVTTGPAGPVETQGKF